MLVQNLLDQRLDKLDQVIVERISEHGMCNDANVLEVSRRSDSLGTVNDAVRDHKVARRNFLTQRTDGGEGNDRLNADGLESGDVGSGGNFGRSVLVVESVSGQEGDLNAGREGGDGDRGRRETPRLERVPTEI